MSFPSIFPRRQPMNSELSAALAPALPLPAGSDTGELRASALAKLAAFHWEWPALGVILILSAVLELLHLDREGYGNQYYASAVLSMTQSWRNFFFVSFDPGGFVSVDKPPLGFWIQTLSAKMFGFSGLSILVPEALALVVSVAVLYKLVRRAFGVVPGLIAALALAFMPVSVVTARNNTIDTLLVLALLLAAWALSIATEQGRLRWLLLSMTIVGLGFAIKMLQAYLVVPAFFFLYFIAAPVRWLPKLGHLLLAGIVLLVVSFAWPVTVDLTPANLRPWVDSTQNNSAVSLALGYNGIERLLGHGANLDRFIEQVQGGQQQDDRGGFVNGGPGGAQETGSPGPLRLINEQLAGQASWLMPLALLGTVVSLGLAWKHRRELGTNPRGHALFLWGGWFATTAIFFSVAGFYHRYYLVMMGPAVAALAAIGVWGAWRAYRYGRWFSWLLPLGLIGTGLLQEKILADYPEWAARLTPVIRFGVFAAAGVLIVAWLASLIWRKWEPRPIAGQVAVSVGLLAVLAAPAVWSGQPAFANGNTGNLPAAGPAGRGGFPGFGGFPGAPGNPAAPAGGQPNQVRPGIPQGPAAGRLPDGRQPAVPGDRQIPGGANGQPPAGVPNGQAGVAPNGGQIPRPGQPGNPAGPFGGQGQQALISYLLANQGSAKYVLATGSSNEAAPIILATGKPVMALGGFSGNDPILTVESFANMVKDGTVRFIIEGGRGFGGFGGGRGDANISSWVRTNCGQVPASATGGQNTGLYDCAAPRTTT